ncbi:hypothetical protein [Polaribacter sp. Asnod1-A03]|uniref:hypothetical protein n=1 Tax=Polaribacter sp. Asnod1-A03 TaxID=3160581 RepID=UPI003865DDA7
MKENNKNFKPEETLKKSKNEPKSAKENLDIPGARNARPLTNDRDLDQIKHDKKSEKEPIENIELDTDYGKEK